MRDLMNEIIIPEGISFENLKTELEYYKSLNWEQRLSDDYFKHISQFNNYKEIVKFIYLANSDPFRYNDKFYLKYYFPFKGLYQCCCGYYTNNPNDYVGHRGFCVTYLLINNEIRRIYLHKFLYWDYDELISVGITDITREQCEAHNKRKRNISSKNITKYNKSPLNYAKDWTPESTGLTQEECDAHNKKKHDLLAKNARIQGIEYGKRLDHNFKIWDDKVTNKTQEEKDAHNKEIYERNFKLWNENCGYGTSMKGWHSYPENLLGEILDKLNFKYIRELYIKIDKNTNFRVDYYLPDYNIILECDGMFKWIHLGSGKYILNDFYTERNILIKNFTGYKIINIPSNSVFYYNKNKIKLFKLIKNTFNEILKSKTALVTYKEYNLVLVNN